MYVNNVLIKRIGLRLVAPWLLQAPLKVVCLFNSAPSHQGLEAELGFKERLKKKGYITSLAVAAPHFVHNGVSE